MAGLQSIQSRVSSGVVANSVFMKDALVRSSYSTTIAVIAISTTRF